MSDIFTVIFAVIISIGMPIVLFSYAVYKKRTVPFILGVLTFVISQMLLRIPLMNYLNKNVPEFTMLSMTQPIIYILILGFSAGIFEEVGRYIMMRFFMKERNWQTGFLFGAGHGGIEAILLVGIQALIILFTSTIVTGDFFVGGIERFFAMLLHIGLSIIVLQSIVKKRIHYLIFAIIIHGVVNSFIGFAPMLFPKQYQLIAIEGLLIVTATVVMIYTIVLKRKGEL